MTVAEYFSKIRSLADEMAAAWKKLDEDDIVSYVLAGLDAGYNSIVSAMRSGVEPITVAELYSQLLSYDMRMDPLSGAGGQSSVNAAVRGGCGGGRGAPPPQGRGNGGRGNGGYGNPGYGNNGFRKWLQQRRRRTQQWRWWREQTPLPLCGKLGHMVMKCWERFNPDFVGVEEKSAGSATSTPYGVDTNPWYIDSGATDHITGVEEKSVQRTSLNLLP